VIVSCRRVPSTQSGLFVVLRVHLQAVRAQIPWEVTLFSPQDAKSPPFAACFRNDRRAKTLTLLISGFQIPPQAFYNRLVFNRF
jgi:hypothetical protein